MIYFQKNKWSKVEAVMIKIADIVKTNGFNENDFLIFLTSNENIKKSVLEVAISEEDAEKAVKEYTNKKGLQSSPKASAPMQANEIKIDNPTNETELDVLRSIRLELKYTGSDIETIRKQTTFFYIMSIAGICLGALSAIIALLK